MLRRGKALLTFSDWLRSVSGQGQTSFGEAAVDEFGMALDVGEATVRTHVASVLDKLGLRDRTQIIIYALKRGVIRVENLP